MWQWASALIGATVAELTGSDAQTGASTAASGTKNNSELLGPIEAFNLFAKAFGYVIVIESGVQVIKNSAGEVIATYSSDVDGWLDSAGTAIGDSIGDLYIWAKNGGNLKRLPDSVIDELGGEEWTQEVKKQTGGSKSDLFWDPKTGEVYSVPKGKRGAPPQHVADVDPRQ